MQQEPSKEVDLNQLKIDLESLFETNNWLGVALQMVDQGKLDIDTLNSLVQWQGFFEQFGTDVSLEINSNDNQLVMDSDKVYANTHPKCLHDLLFAKIKTDRYNHIPNLGIFVCLKVIKTIICQKILGIILCMIKQINN